MGGGAASHPAAGLSSKGQTAANAGEDVLCGNAGAFTLGGVKQSYQTDFKVNGIRRLHNDKNFIRELETVEKEPNGNSRTVKQLSEVKNHGNAFKSKLNSPKEYHITGRQIRRNYPS